MFGEDRLFQSILLASKYMSGGNREAPNMALQDTAARLIEYLGTFGRTFPTNLLNLASWTHRNRQPTTLVLFCRWKNFKVQDMAGFIERFAKLSGVLAVVGATVNGSVLPRASDPCAAISGQKWVAPRAVRDCYSTVKVNETLKNNVSHFHLFPSFLSDALAWQILDVVGRTLNFHTSVNIKFKHLHHSTKTSMKTFLRIWIGLGRQIMLVIMTCTLIFPELSRGSTMDTAFGSTVAMWVPV